MRTINYQIRQIEKTDVLKLRQKGLTPRAIGAELGMSEGKVWLLIREALAEAAAARKDLGELQLEETLQQYQFLERVILSRGRINLDHKVLALTEDLAKARETGGKVNGRSAEELERELRRIESMNDETLGLENEDIDRLISIRDRINKLLGIEPPKKVSVEHTFIMQAKSAQDRLRQRLGITEVVPTADGPGVSVASGPGDTAQSPDVLDAEVLDSAGDEQHETDPIGDRASSPST